MKLIQNAFTMCLYKSNSIELGEEEKMVRLIMMITGYVKIK